MEQKRDVQIKKRGKERKRGVQIKKRGKERKRGVQKKKRRKKEKDKEDRKGGGRRFVAPKKIFLNFLHDSEL